MLKVECYRYPIVDKFYVEIFEKFVSNGSGKIWEFWLCCIDYGVKNYIIGVDCNDYKTIDDACNKICNLDYLIDFIYDYYNNVINKE